jgi:hypothetical protein
MQLLVINIIINNTTDIHGTQEYHGTRWEIVGVEPCQYARENHPSLPACYAVNNGKHLRTLKQYL